MNAESRLGASRQARFEALLDGHAGIVMRVVRTYCRQADDQQDLAQEIKLELWRAFAKYDERRTFSTWMYRIALNVAISWLRRSGTRNRQLTPLQDAHRIAAPAESDDNLQTLYRLIDGLDPLNRALLLLYMDDLKHTEIGEILGITPVNVATKISRLKQQLRQQATESKANT